MHKMKRLLLEPLLRSSLQVWLELVEMGRGLEKGSDLDCRAFWLWIFLALFENSGGYKDHFKECQSSSQTELSNFQHGITMGIIVNGTCSVIRAENRPEMQQASWLQ